MTEVANWKATAAGNDITGPPDFPKEGWGFNEVNDWAREAMAAVRRWYADPEWLNLNYGLTITRLGTTQLKVVGIDATGWFTANRRIKVVGATTDYGYTESSSYASGDTTVTVTMDSGDVPGSPTQALVHHSRSLGRSAYTLGWNPGDLRVFYGRPSAVAAGWLLCDGTACGRTTYSALFDVLTYLMTGSTTFGSAVVTALSSTADMVAGMPVEGTGIPSGTTILSVDSSTQVTLSANATSGGSPSLRFFLTGAGDGSTTFNVPDYRGKTIIGVHAGGDADGDYRVAGKEYGEKKHTLTTAELPAHDHSPASDGLTGYDAPPHQHSLQGTWLTYGGVLLSGSGNSTSAGSSDYTSVPISSHYHALATVGSGTAHENRQPSRTALIAIKT